MIPCLFQSPPWRVAHHPSLTDGGGRITPRYDRQRETGAPRWGMAQIPSACSLSEQ